MAVLPIFCQKWDIIVHNARTITRKNLVTNGMDVTTIQLSFDTILMSPSLTNMLVFLMLYDNFPPGVPLMSGFKSRCRQRFGWVNRAPQRRNPLTYTQYYLTSEQNSFSVQFSAWPLSFFAFSCSKHCLWSSKLQYPVTSHRNRTSSTHANHRHIWRVLARQAN